MVTLSGGGDGAHCLRPCPQCPWRKDSPIGAFPPKAFEHSASTAYDAAFSTFACHMAGKEKPMTCAGFLLSGAEHNIAVRLMLATGKLDVEQLSDGGVELYTSYREMAEANGVDPDSAALAPTRPYKDEQWYRRNNREGT